MFRCKAFTAVLALAFILTSGRPAVAQASHDEVEAFFDAYLAEQMEAHHIPGVVVSVVKAGEVLFTKGYGYADLEARAPFDEDTLLTVASLGKTFTAVGVLQLNERGVIDLHEDTRPYFSVFRPSFAFDEPLTFAHLLTHTDGFESRLIGVGAFDESELMPLGELLATQRPNQVAPPGRFLTYSDYAASLAGYLTESITGLRFEDYMRDHILAPLGMEHSTFDQLLTVSMRARLATGYRFEGGTYHPEPFVYISSAPGGGLRTTAADMNRFMLALLEGGEDRGRRVLEADSVRSMFAQQFTGETDMPGVTYGLFEDFQDGQRALLRDGDGIGTRTRMLLLPEHRTGIFVSYNSGDSNLRLDLLAAYLERFHPTERAAPVPMVGHEARAPRFAGTYRILQADVSTFGKSMYFFSQLVQATANRDGTLSIRSTGMGDDSNVMGGFEGETRWVEVAPLRFARLDGHGVIAFVQDDGGGIAQMISGQGYHSSFARLRWYESSSFQTGFIGLTAIVLIAFGLVVFLFVPIGAWRRRLRRVPTPAQPRAALVALVWGGVVALWLAISVFQTIGVLYAIDSRANLPNFVWGISPGIVQALNGVYVPVVLSLSLPVLAIAAWVKGWWRPGLRVLYTAAAVATLMLIWWADYWNLIGYRA